MISQAEENYLKAIFKVCEKEGNNASTNAIAQEMQTSAASVTDMLKRLAEKNLLHYERYRGVHLTEEGDKLARNLVRKHRLWEVFLVDKLQFSWDEVHEIAEQLEHIQSAELVDRLDKFLGFPRFDPHGDPIPDAEGNFTFRRQTILAEVEPGCRGVVVGVQEHAPTFLQHLDRLGLVLGAELHVLERFEFDGSMRLNLGEQGEVVISQKVSQQVFIQKQAV
jgi:DtxR family Mn-dependent transcriptional regulator